MSGWQRLRLLLSSVAGLTVSDQLRVALVGLGVGATHLLPALTTSPFGRLVAAADVRAEARERLASECGVQAYASVEVVCELPEVEAVWVATPNHLHAEHAITAMDRGKHVIVSKPMAISLAEAENMVAAAERNKVKLLAGHSQCMAPTIRRMAELARSGELGRLGMLHTWHYTDWMYRPRLPAELDVARGGGPVFRQASHQVDIVRSIAGQAVRSVRAMTVQLDEKRGPPGAYTVYLQFADGTPATIVYSGYGHFDLSAWLGRRPTRPRDSLTEDEAAQKNALRYGVAGSRGANSLGLFGLTLASFEQADLRESPEGLELYQRGQRQVIRVPDEPRATAELHELFQAVRQQHPLVHDGRWGKTTLEVCLAIHESARTQREIHWPLC
jgi:phthalate 4,5-cis-dihydrodiol dehydrogenase